jgi:hypothetical protein
LTIAELLAQSIGPCTRSKLPPQVRPLRANADGEAANDTSCEARSEGWPLEPRIEPSFETECEPGAEHGVEQLLLPVLGDKSGTPQRCDGWYGDG